MHLEAILIMTFGTHLPLLPISSCLARELQDCCLEETMVLISNPHGTFLGDVTANETFGQEVSCQVRSPPVP